MKTLLLLTLSGSALALLLLALRYLFLKRMPSTVYYYAWLLVLLRFALPLPGLIPDGSTAQNAPPDPVRVTEHAARTESETGLPAIDAPAWTAASEPQDDKAPIPALDLPQQETPSQFAEPAADVHTAGSINLKNPLLWQWIWAFGTLISLSVPALAYLRFTRTLRKTLRAPAEGALRLYKAIPGKKPALYVSRAVKTPLTLGLFAPKIILPANLAESELLNNVFRHELTHVRRRDTLYKWLALAVFSAHWFNPLTYLLRRELDKACELSCDEALLRSMTLEEKRAYGNTLLQMAASGALPVGVVATTFATEKKNLKERLEQIMTYRKGSARVLAALLALALLAGCGVIAGPAAENAPPDDPPADAPEPVSTEKPASARPTEGGVAEVHVSTVDELLAAIAPNTVIVLAKGDYDLSTAENYGKKPEGAYYDWNSKPGANTEGEQHFELVINGVDNLTFRGEDPEQTRILIQPRYANVIRFVNCQFPGVEALTIGHTDGAYCFGGVLRFEGCGSVTICNCGLFGCGTIGVWAQDCDGVYVINSRIYECSDAAVSVAGCREVHVELCDIYDHGLRNPNTGTVRSLLEASDTDGFAVYNNRIHDSAMQYLLNCNRVRNAFFLSNEVRDNRIEAAVFAFQQYPCVVDGCVFADNESSVNDGVPLWVISHKIDPIDPEGNPLDGDALESMALSESDPNMPFPSVAIEAAAEVSRGASITVKTVDEFLKAIGPDRTIVLDGELFDLSAASNYGKTGTEYYYWNECNDGLELVIQNVTGLSILAFSEDAAATTISAVPRYADVLTFKSCSEIDLVGFTAGHTKEPGSCSGGVLNLNDCHSVRIDRCRLYGCGILGLETHDCTGISVKETEIFECSQGAGRFYYTDGIVFTDCIVHDVPSPHFFSQYCGDMSWNGEPMHDATNLNIGEDGKLTSSFQGTAALNEHLTGISLDREINPFANEPAHSLEPGSAMEAFASQVQQYVRDGDLDSLADSCAYPLTIFLGDHSMSILSRDAFIHWMASGSFLSQTFTEDWMQRIGEAELLEYGQCAFGNTVLDHCVAVAVVRDSAGTGGEPAAEDFAITCISFAGALWPGQAS